jgi:predicted ATPase
LDWSHDLLSDKERIIFRRIAIFVGQFTLEDAQRIAAESDSGRSKFADAIAGLFEKSLLATRVYRGQPQYRLLNTTRAYALGKLEEDSEVDVISARHADYVAEQL